MPALLDKIKDKDLLKVHGFIGGQWVSASDGTTMEVLRACLLVSDEQFGAPADLQGLVNCPWCRSRIQLQGKSLPQCLA